MNANCFTSARTRQGKIVMLAAIVIASALTLILPSCKEPDNSPKSITIIYIPPAKLTGKVMISLVTGFKEDAELIATGTGIITDGTVTFEMLDAVYGDPWTGNGSYYISLLSLEEGGHVYLYTRGVEVKDFKDLNAIPKRNITTAKDEITFYNFVQFGG